MVGNLFGQEDLQKQVDIGLRSLVEGFQQTPLREFTGVLESFEAERDAQFDRIRVRLQFSEVAVIATAEPYPFPIAQLTIPFSQRRVSSMGFLVSSIDALLPGGSISSLLKKRVRMKLEAKNFGRWRGQEEDTIRECWVTVSLEGESKAESRSAYEIALDLAVGQSVDDLKAFYQQVFKDPSIRADKELQGAILNKSFIPAALESGDLEVDENGTLGRPSAV